MEEKVEDLKCRCGKILSQRKGKILVIKCRHCKRMVLINLEDPAKIEFQ